MTVSETNYVIGKTIVDKDEFDLCVEELRAMQEQANSCDVDVLYPYIDSGQITTDVFVEIFDTSNNGILDFNDNIVQHDINWCQSFFGTYDLASWDQILTSIEDKISGLMDVDPWRRKPLEYREPSYRMRHVVERWAITDAKAFRHDKNQYNMRHLELAGLLAQDNETVNAMIINQTFESGLRWCGFYESAGTLLTGTEDVLTMDKLTSMLEDADECKVSFAAKALADTHNDNSI